MAIKPQKKEARNMKGITSLLKNYFRKRDDISWSFIFGSEASGRLRKDSDIDVGVYFKPKTDRIEIEDAEAKYETTDL